MKRIIGLLASLKTAIFLIGLLTLLAIVGTLIPQRLEAIDYIQKFPRCWQYIMGFGFDDMYRSWLFVGTLTLLSASAMFCVVLRWKATSTKLFSRIKQTSVSEIKSFKTFAILEKAPTEEILHGFAIFNLEDGTKAAFRSRGKLALIGGLILHLGLVLVFVGGLLGLIFGVEMTIGGKEGERIPVPSIDAIRAAVKADNLSRQARSIRQFSPNDPRLNEMRTEIEELHQKYNEGMMKPEFKLIFDRLWVDNYSDEKGNVEGVKSWNSRVSFQEITPGTFDEVATESQPMLIQVNYPITYKDYGFFQSGWNKNWTKIKLRIDYIEGFEGWKDYKPEAWVFPQFVEVRESEPFDIKGFDFSFVVNSFMPDFRVMSGGFYNASNELKNPAAMIVCFDKNANCEVGHTWAFTADKQEMAKHVSDLPFVITFEGAESEYESILQMAYDPGKPLVWLGCILFCLGMMMTFYIAYIEEWVLFNNDGTALIAINSNRPANVLIKELEEFKSRLMPDSRGKNNE